MALGAEMRRLTLRLGEDHAGRTAAVVGIRTAVARELSAFRTDRQAEAEAQRRRLRLYMGALDSDTGALLAGLWAARANLSREQQRKLAGDIAALRQGVGALLDQWNSARLATAQEQQARLCAHMDALRTNMAALRDRLEVAYQAMANEQQQALGRNLSDMQSRVDQLLKDFDQAIHSMASEQRQKLAKENQSLKDEVVVFRTSIGADLAEAGQLWTGYSNLMRQQGASQAQATLQAPVPNAAKKKGESLARIAEPVPPDLPAQLVASDLPAQLVASDLPAQLVAPDLPTHVAEATLPEPGAVQDLRAIPGVGPGMERRLHKAGIYGFAQLAAMTAEELRRAVGAEAFVQVESWIERARELAEQE